jgi:hypothetical protein
VTEPDEPDEVYQSKIDFASIKNKATRARLRREEAEAKDKFRREKREKRKREREEAGDGPVRTRVAPPTPLTARQVVKRAPKTIESKREFDETVVDPDDEEVGGVLALMMR